MQNKISTKFLQDCQLETIKSRVEIEAFGKKMLVPDPVVVDVINGFVGIDCICSLIVIEKRYSVRCQTALLWIKTYSWNRNSLHTLRTVFNSLV